MTPELWQRLKPFLVAPPGCDWSERTRSIEQTCAEHPGLNYLLQTLLIEEERTRTLHSLLTDAGSPQGDGGSTFQIGQVVLNRFRIVRAVGAGGMGEVYEAVDLQLGTVALKTIREQIASSRDAFERFRQEVQLARRVSGRQVCRIHELFLLPANAGKSQTAFLSMEYLDGVTLSARLRDQGPIPWKEALPIILDICEGLSLIHEKGIIHRDLKCANIMLCGQSSALRTVLMDFGLAHDFSPKISSEDSTATLPPAWTNPGAIVGTPAYMAPEQFQPGAAVSPATDIYALGLILYEMLTGIHPYSAPTPAAAAIRRAQQFRTPSSVRSTIPRHWSRIIERCLQFEQQQRFQSAPEVARALRSRPWQVRNLRRDRPWVLWLAAALVLCIAAWNLGLWWQVRQQYHPSAEELHWYNAGVDALREGDSLKATRLLQQATSADSHYVMAHARLAQAWSNLDFDGNAQRELLLATRREQHLPPLDRISLDAIQALVTRDSATEISLDQQILTRLPPDQKSAGYVDLGMAFERAGDPTRALQNYAQAASLDHDNPAPWMRTAILQSRLHHLPEAADAFDQAQKLLALKMDAEGQAEFDYQRGYSANEGGDTANAKTYLEDALASKINSIQLQIRVLTQLSNVAYASGHNDEAVDEATRAIDLAQSNGLELWAADGYVRRANAEIQQGRLQAAESDAGKASQLSQQGQLLRPLAGANLALASIMNQRNLPDQVIAPAQAALAYYSKYGFTGPATMASLLLVRAQRDKGEWSQALASGKALLSVAVKSSNRSQIVRSEELLGSIYLQMEQYPAALDQFQKAFADAAGTSAQPYQALDCAETLWKLGRYDESAALIGSPQISALLQRRADRIQLDSLLSRMKFAPAEKLAQKLLDADPGMDADAHADLELEAALADSHLHRNAAAQKRLADLPTQPVDTPDGWQTQLSLAEIHLALGALQTALDTAAHAAAHFAATGQPESRLRSLCIEAAAAKLLNNHGTYTESSQQAVDILAQLAQTWEPQALRLYLSRPDLQSLFRASGISAPFDRR